MNISIFSSTHQFIKRQFSPCVFFLFSKLCVVCILARLGAIVAKNFTRLRCFVFKYIQIAIFNSRRPCLLFAELISTFGTLKNSTQNIHIKKPWTRKCEFCTMVCVCLCNFCFTYSDYIGCRNGLIKFTTLTQY